MVAAVLGIAVEADRVFAVAVRRGKVLWAAEAPHAGCADLTDVLARLAAERPARIKATRVALSSELAQYKIVYSIPALKARDLAAHVALEPRRYFLQNGTTLVTDAVPLPRARRNGTRSAALAAAPAPLVDAITEGVRAAGLALETIAPISAFNGQAGEDVPSGLHTLGGGAMRYRDAYRAACGAALVVLLAETDRLQSRRTRATSARRWVAVGACSLLLAAAGEVASLRHQRYAANRGVATLGPMVTRAMAASSDLSRTTEALAFLASLGRERSRHARLLAQLTRTLPDSAFLAALRLEEDGEGTLVGFAPRAAQVPAALERVGVIRAPVLDGAVTREVVGGREWDRFTVRFRLTQAAGNQ